MSSIKVRKEMLWFLSATAAAIVAYMVIEFGIKPLHMYLTRKGND